MRDKIVKYMRDGNFFETACKAAGIGPSTGFMWMAWGRGEKKYGNLDAPKDPSIYVDFLEAVTHAEGEAEAEIVGYVRDGVEKDPRIGIEFLRRRNQAQWNNSKVQLEHSGRVKVEHSLDEVLERYGAAFDTDDDFEDE
jgi:hypothetical protein